MKKLSEYRIEARIEGLEVIKRAMDRHAARLKPDTLNIMVEEMEGAVSESQNEAAGRGWKLATDIRMGPIDPDELTVEGGSYAPHSGFVEFGTIYMNARPFWRPFVWSHFFQMLDRLKRLQGELWR